MVTIAAILDSISAQKFQLSHSLLTFHNYLQHHLGQQVDLNDESLSDLESFENTWTSDLLQRFFDSTMLYPHWVQNRNILSKDIRSSLQEVQNSIEYPLGLDSVTWPDQIQIFEVDTRKNCSDLISAYLHNQYKKTGSKFRLISDQDKYYYALVLNSDRSLHIRQFDKKFRVREGFLEPLRTHLGILFDPDLEIVTQQVHELEIAPFVTCRFAIKEGALDATLSRGYLFQRFHQIKSGQLESYPRLFWLIKKIESFFLKPETNPFYAQITHELERTSHLIRIGDAPNFEKVTDLQVRAQNALEHVFQSDKVLKLLLRDLQNLTAEKTAEKATAKAKVTEQWKINSNLDLQARQPVAAQIKPADSLQEKVRLANAQIQRQQQAQQNLLESDLISF